MVSVGGSMARYHSTVWAAMAMCTSIAFGWSLPGRSLSESISFLRDVKPILARRCFSCHGPSKQEAGLRLDQPERALAELDSGVRAIVSSHVEKSAIVDRVTAIDDSERMPPTGKPLAEHE